MPNEENKQVFKFEAIASAIGFKETIDATKNLTRELNLAQKQLQTSVGGGKLPSSYATINSGVMMGASKFDTMSQRSAIANAQKQQLLLTYQPSKQNEEIVVQTNNSKKLNEVFDKTGDSADKLGKKQKDLGEMISIVSKKALLTIPTWMALRAIFLSIIGSISDTIRSMVEFDTALARVKNVVTDVTDMNTFIKQLSGEVRQLASETGTSMASITDAFYEFKDAGLSTSAAVAGMNTAVKGSIAFLTDAKETARALTDIYILYGNKIEGVNTEQEKMNLIMSSIAVLQQSNKFRLDEYMQSMKNFASEGRNSNLTLEQMLTLLAVTHTQMQRGSRGGTQLAMAFRTLSSNSEKAGEFLNKTINPSTMNSFDLFIEVITKLNTKLKEGKNITSEVNEIFGTRGSRSVSALSSEIELLFKEYEKLTSMSLADRMNVLTKMYENQTHTVARQVEIMKTLRTQAGETFLIATTGGKDFVEALVRLNSYIRNNIIPTMTYLGVLLKRIFEPGEKKTFAENLQKGFMRWSALGPIGMLIEKGQDKGKSVADETIEKLNEYYANYDERLQNQTSEQGAVNSLKEAQAKIEEESNNSLRYQLLMLEKRKMYGFTDIEIEKEKLKLITDVSDKRDQELKILQMENEEMLKYSDTLKNSIQESFKSFMSGEGTFGGIFTSLNKAMAEGYRTTVSEGVANLFAGTGFGEMFARAMGGLKGQIQTAHQVVYNLIVKGHRDGMMLSSTSASTAQWLERGGGSLGALSYVTSYGASQGYSVGQTPNINLPNIVVSRKRNMYEGFLGRASASAITGYSAYQSGATSGLSRGMSIGGGVLTGLGTLGIMSGVGGLGSVGTAFAGGLAGAGAVGGGSLMSGIGAALGAIGPMGWLALGGLLVGTLMSSGLFGGKQTQTSVETKTSENKISSRIDVTNRQLEIVNRNLLALKSSIETYILPSSAYFSSKSSIEDQWALMSSRGFMG